MKIHWLHSYDIAPIYLKELLNPYNVSRTLRQGNNHMVIEHFHMPHPVCEMHRPDQLRTCSSFTSFKSKVKVHLFKRISYYHYTNPCSCTSLIHRSSGCRYNCPPFHIIGFVLCSHGNGSDVRTSQGLLRFPNWTSHGRGMGKHACKSLQCKTMSVR